MPCLKPRFNACDGCTRSHVDPSGGELPLLEVHVDDKQRRARNPALRHAAHAPLATGQCAVSRRRPAPRSARARV
jgi:hypothetical protein